MTEDRDTHLGRRTLVRVGATAAWTVPVIAMAAPAQAATCSGGSTSLTVALASDLGQSGKNQVTRSLQVQVCNTGTSASCALSATVGESGGAKKVTSFSVGDWPAASSVDGDTSLTVLAPASGQLAPNGCATYLVTFKVKNGATSYTLAFRTSNGGLATLDVSVS